MLFLLTDDKKGVDRASTVIAREANEGTALTRVDDNEYELRNDGD